MNNNNNISNSSEISFTSGNYNIIKDEYENNNNLNNSINSFNSSKIYNKDIIQKKETKIKYYMCNNCKSCPKIIFEDNLLNICCGCKEITNLTLKDFNDKYSHKDLKKIEKFLGCEMHKLNIYKYYCIDDKKNFCEECKKISKKHENHSVFRLSSDDKIKEIEQIKDIIKQKRKITPKGDIECRGRLNIIESLLECYKRYPCYNIYKSIKNGKKYLDKLDIKELKERLKINNIKELRENKNSSLSFLEINISSQNFSDLSIFYKLELKNLKILKLNENNIINIEPLLKPDFDELKEIHLEGNKLNYQSLKDFQNMKFKKIKFINLFINEIESPKIFEKILNFKTLKIFYCGQNKLTNEEIEKSGNTKYDLCHLKRIFLTDNFTNENINFISNFKLQNLEYIYLNKNNLSSLSFLKDMDWPNLVSFWARENYLTNYNDILNLKYKDKIKRINLKDNNIENIDNLIEFISKFPKLKLLILVNNKINLDNPKNRQIIEDIKSKYNNLQLIMNFESEKTFYLEEEKDDDEEEEEEE